MNERRKIIIAFYILILLLQLNVSAKSVISTNHFQFVIYKDGDPIAKSLIKDISEINEEMKRYFIIERTEKPIIIELVDLKNDKMVTGRDYINMPDWIAAYAVPSQNRIVLRYNSIGTYPYIEIREVIKHELTHIYLDKLLQRTNNYAPKWFQEGLAMHIGRKWAWEDYYQLTIGMLRINHVPLSKLKNTFPDNEYDIKIAYAESFSFVNYLVKIYGDDFLKKLLIRLGSGEKFDSAIISLTKKSVEEIEKDWIDDSLKYYRWIPFIASTTFIWMIITLLSIFIYWKRYKKIKLIHKRWEEEENDF